MKQAIDEELLTRQREFSAKAFGPGRRTNGIIQHIRKELDEVAASPYDLSEWADVIILALDGAWRHGSSPEEIIAAVVNKMRANEERDWPDWHNITEDEAIEHNRHQRGCASTQGMQCNCNSPGTINGVVGYALCLDCGLDNRNASHDALEMIGHLMHSYRPQ